MGGIVQVDSVLNNNTSNLITQTNSTTITIGSTGQTISLASGASSSGFGLTWNPTVQTTNFTASVGVGYMVNTTTAAITATLPAAPSIGDQVAFVDFNETAATNNIILNPNGLKIDGTTSTTNIVNGGEGVTIMYSGTTRGWIPVSAANEGTTALISPYNIDFLVVAGGGGGGTLGGGGGAGGYRTSTQSATPGTVITVTVGDGGAGSTGAYNSPGTRDGSTGSNSSISGSSLTTITSAGGGGAGGYQAAGKNGGSGGGNGSENTSGAGGVGNTPSTSPSQGNNGGTTNAFAPNYGSAGGGGASAVGSNGTTTTGGNGGAGTASSITGSSVTRAGGGGGSTNNGGTAGTGSAGGGNGTTNSSNGSSATANTGSGGGGGGYVGGNGGLGGAGGKGVVILSMATIHYSGTSSGSPTVTTSGSNTILQFNGSGTYTA